MKKGFIKRKLRARFLLKKLSKPRLLVFRSNKHIYAQIVGSNREILAAASTLDKGIKTEHNKNYKNKACAALVGDLVARRAVAKNIHDVVFDKSGYKYHGTLSVLADASRKLLNF